MASGPSPPPRIFVRTPPASRRLYSQHYAEGWQSPAYCTGLENRQGVKTLTGSNPVPSAYLQGFC